MQDLTQLDDLLSVKTFASRYPDLVTEPALRWQVFNAHSNGLGSSGALIRVGRKILIDRGRYRDWLTRNRTTSN
jgi:hypothetical protein